MRHHGRRLKHTEWVNQPVVKGDLTLAELSAKHGPVKFVSLTDSSTGLRTPLLPDLYEPVVTMLGNWIPVLRGFERCDGREGNSFVVQEWHCTVQTE